MSAGKALITLPEFRNGEMIVVSGKIIDDRFIHIDTKIGDAAERAWRKTIDMEDQLVRKALIRLGWTPPA
jgi:hypothetical protein